jgi:starch phosphorylase
MGMLTPRFSANRTVREYTEKYYLSLAEKYSERSSNKGAAGTRITKAQQEIAGKWDHIHFGEVKFNKIEHGYSCKVSVNLAGINPRNVIVEVYADEKGDAKTERVEMKLKSSDNDTHEYCADIKTGRQPGDFTPRIIPGYENIIVPLEDNHILWQH